MSPLRGVIAVTLLVTLTSAAEPTPSLADLRLSAKEIVGRILVLVDQTRNGGSLSSRQQDVLDLRDAASDLIQQLGKEVSECETQAVIKMAAAGTGSHEVLTVLTAEDPLSVLNGRLSLSLALLQHVAQQLQDELTLSDNMGPYLAAIVFGANTTATIIETADVTVKSMMGSGSQDVTDGKDSSKANRVKRQTNPFGLGGFGQQSPPFGLGSPFTFSPPIPQLNLGSSFTSRPPIPQLNLGSPVKRRPLIPPLNLGSGFSLGLDGLKWQNRRGTTSVYATPTFKNSEPGFKLGVKLNF